MTGKVIRMITLLDKGKVLQANMDEAWARVFASPTQDAADELSLLAKGVEKQWYDNLDAIVELGKSF